MESRIAPHYRKVSQTLSNIGRTAERMGISFPTEFVGEDPITDFIRTASSLYGLEPWDESLANLDDLTTNRQVLPGRSNIKDQPEGLAYSYDDADKLILSIAPGDEEFADFNSLPTEDAGTLKIESDDDPANAFPETVFGNAFGTPVALGEQSLELDGHREAAEKVTAREVVNKTVRTEDKERQRSRDDLTTEENARRHPPIFPGRPAHMTVCISCGELGHDQRTCQQKLDFCGTLDLSSERILCHCGQDGYHETRDDETEGNKNDVEMEQMTKKFRDLTPHSEMRVKAGTDDPPKRLSLPCTIRITPKEETLADNNNNSKKNTESEVQIITDDKQTPPGQQVETTYSCSTCEEKFDNVAFLINHQSEEHNELYFCRCCEKQFMNQEEITAHWQADET